MPYETIFGVIAVLLVFAAIMFFAFNQRQREHKQLLEAYEAGDKSTFRRGVISGVIVLIGFVVMIGYQEGIEGPITIFAGMAVMGGLAFFGWCATQKWRQRTKRDNPPPDLSDRYSKLFLFGGMLLASTAFAIGTAILVEFHGAITIVVYYVVIPPVVGLIIFLQWAYRRLRGRALDKKQ